MNTQLELYTGEKLRWDRTIGECVVSRQVSDQQEIIAVFKNLNSSTAEILPRNGGQVITPKCLKHIKELFPSCVIHTWRKR